MSNESKQQQRRVLLQIAAGMAVTPFALAEEHSTSASNLFKDIDLEPGKLGDFDFLNGEWKISHRRLKKMGGQDWDHFEGEATCWSLLNGLAYIEELRVPARNFNGMGIRLLDVEKKRWSDLWVNARNGVLSEPGTEGGFKQGVGIFISRDKDGDKPVLVRGMWDQISAKTCRWQQALSYDDGRTWQDRWLMNWRRA